MTNRLALVCGALWLWLACPNPGAAQSQPAAPARPADAGEPQPLHEPPRSAPGKALAAQEKALRTSLAPTAVVIARTPTTLELWYPVRLAFVADGTELLPAATAMLELLAHSLRQFERSKVVVAVYTDAIGSSTYNQQQSQARAAVVVAYLLAQGIAPERLEARGAGESAQLEAPNTPEGRDLNRRLQVVITPLS